MCLRLAWPTGSNAAKRMRKGRLNTIHWVWQPGGVRSDSREPPKGIYGEEMGWKSRVGCRVHLRPISLPERRHLPELNYLLGASTWKSPRHFRSNSPQTDLLSSLPWAAPPFRVSHLSSSTSIQPGAQNQRSPSCSPLFRTSFSTSSILSQATITRDL